MLRVTDDAVTAGLRQFVAKEHEYVAWLRSVDSDVARRLRFTSLDDATCPIVREFTDTAAELAYLHQLFANSIQTIVDDAAGTVEQVAAVLEQLLLVTRVLYARLHVRHHVLTTAMDRQLKAKTAAASSILKTFMQHKKIQNSQQLVALPLTHFEDVLERAEIILCSTHLTACCDATRAFLQHAVRDHQHEQALVHLQHHLQGSALATDFCGRTLAWRGLVTLVPSKDDHGVTILANDVVTRPLHDVCCLDDGTVLFIEQSQTEGTKPTGLCINLKHDAVFKESVPASLGTRPSIVLLGPTSGLYLSTVDHDAASSARFNGFVECTTALLQQNGSRLAQLKHGRSANILDLPSDLRQLVDGAAPLQPLVDGAAPLQPLVAFPCFHDDELPSVFWLQSDTTAWKLVELVQWDTWLLVFVVSGWRRHALLHRVDLADASTTITDAPRRDDTWALVLSSGSDTRIKLELVSARRQRIDFWYDQVAKAIANAAAERKKLEAQAARAAAKQKAIEEAEAAATARAKAAVDGAGFINARAKKRQRNTTPRAAADTPTTAPTPPQTTADESVPPTSARKRRKTPTTNSSIAEQPQEDDGEASDVHTQPEATSTTASASKRQRTPPVKTPKQRWVNRKIEDPDDATLEATQPTAEPDADAASSVAPTIRIVFTGIEPTPKTFKKIDAIPGAVYEEDVTKATHVVAPTNTLKRTVKLLCGISCCDHIVDEQWLDASARVHTAVYERQHCLKDAKAESKWGFDLRKTMYDVAKSERQALFQGRRVYITSHKSILPPVQDLVKIVECAGGEVVVRGSPTKDDLVITHETAMATASVQRTLATADPHRIFTPELVLSSILQQRIDLTQNQLENRGRGGGASRR